MARWQMLVRSLVGKKAIMAVTGLVLFLFVIAHLLGNLKVFEGPAKFDAYAAGLRAIGAPVLGPSQFLWGARIVLLVSVLAHIWAAVGVTRASWAARRRSASNRGACRLRPRWRSRQDPPRRRPERRRRSESGAD